MMFLTAADLETWRDLLEMGEVKIGKYGADGAHLVTPHLEAYRPGISSRDVVSIAWLATNAYEVEVYSANESHHNGDHWDSQHGTTPMTPELAAAILAAARADRAKRTHPLARGCATCARCGACVRQGAAP